MRKAVGTHKQFATKLAQDSQASPSLSKRLLPLQRKLEHINWHYRTSMIMLVVLVGLLSARVVWPVEPSVISSPSSNLIAGGVTSSAQQARQVLSDTSNNPLLSSVYDYFGISNTALSNLQAETIDLSTDDYYVVTRRATANQPETNHTHRGQQFYDSPLSDLLAANVITTTVFSSSLDQPTTQAVTGMNGIWFGILPDSGNLVIKKGNDSSGSARVFRSQTSAQPGDQVKFYVEIKTNTGEIARNPQLELSLPAGVALTDFKAPEPFSQAAVVGQTAVFNSPSDRDLGGNNQLWITASLQLPDEIADGTEICPNASLVGQSHSSLFSDSHCVVVAAQATNVTADCQQADNGKFQLTGSYEQITDQDCVAAFASAVYQQPAIRESSGSLVVNLQQINLGSDQHLTPPSLDLSDLDEYTGTVEVNGGVYDESALRATWFSGSLSPNQSRSEEAVLSSLDTRPSSLPAATDRQSFDNTLQLTANNNPVFYRLDQPFIHSLESTVSRLPRLNDSRSLVVMVVILGANGLVLAQNRQTVDRLKRARREHHGGHNA